MSRSKKEERPSLSVLALASFIASFLVARVFATFYPSVVLVRGGIHFHHFWFGIILQAIGGWLGISYNDERINRLAAILFGAGGGLIVDEVGLLLTFENYSTPITYTVVVTFAAVMSIVTLVIRYSRMIGKSLSGFTKSNASLYFGVFLAIVSIAYIAETNDFRVNVVSGLLTLVAIVIILAYFVQSLRNKRQHPAVT